MNRAFVKDNDGWNRCKFKMESCMMADEQGGCILDVCKQDPSFVPPKEETAEVPAGKTVEKTLAEPGTKAPDKAPDKAPEKPAAKSSGKF
ncbi:MAG: hypothetical protein IJQ03_02740 [Firmicutes bacterium]|jgi:hypothetical protein|nr:hypothetical protein [Bacillota bacterium]